jgi:hypothetical protein
MKLIDAGLIFQGQDQALALRDLDFADPFHR